MFHYKPNILGLPHLWNPLHKLIPPGSEEQLRARSFESGDAQQRFAARQHDGKMTKTGWTHLNTGAFKDGKKMYQNMYPLVI